MQRSDPSYQQQVLTFTGHVICLERVYIDICSGLILSEPVDPPPPRDLQPDRRFFASHLNSVVRLLRIKKNQKNAERMILSFSGCWV